MKKQTKFTGVIQHAVLALDRIVPSKTNPRKHFNDADIAELAESIKANGQQMAIIVRLENEHTEARYEIIDGERRYRACLALQMTDILADVREMDDAQVAEYQLMTFLHRKDITPLEEAQAYIDLSKKGIDPAEIAARVGKPVSHIVRTARLLKLIPSALKSLQKGELPIGHAFEICRLQAKDQERVMGRVFTETFSRGEENIEEGKVPINFQSLKNFIQEQIHLDLRKISFSKTDPALVAKAGPCTHCVKRSGFNQGLFPDIQQSDTCTDPACFKAKVEAHITQQKEKLKAEKQKVVEITPEYRKPADHPQAITYRSYKEVKGKPCKYAVNGIAVDGPDRGKVMLICNNKECNQHWKAERRNSQVKPEKEEKKKTPEQIERDRLKDLQAKMEHEANELYMERLEELIAKNVPTEMPTPLFMRIAEVLDGNWYINKPARKALGIKGNQSIAKLPESKVIQFINLATHLAIGEQHENEDEELLKQIKITAGLFGIDHTNVLKQAQKEISEKYERELRPKQPDAPKAEDAKPKRNGKFRKGTHKLPRVAAPEEEEAEEVD